VAPPPSSSLAAIAQQQAQNNRNSAKHAEAFAGHRRALTAALLDRAPAGDPGTGRVCLLGAGNAQDVDLRALAARFAEIHLVDLDQAALQRAFERAAPEVRAKLSRHAPVDLSGVLGNLDRWKRAVPTRAEIDAAIAPAAAAIAARLPGPFDLVASCCLVTQLSLGLTGALGPAHPQLREARRAVAAIHLRSMAALLRPGGRALFVSDLVAEDTYPLDALEPDADLAALVGALVAAGNFFHGADPTLFGGLLRRDPELAARFAPAQPLAPWLWQNGPARLFLVYGFSVERR
jgi:SAM-dependent methyltransferase